MAAPVDVGAGLREIVARSVQRNLDPLAVIAVAKQEGLSEGIGDSGHAYGPFQLNNQVGVIAGRFPGNPANDPGIQSWAWSKAGIDFAVDRIAQVAGGTTGSQAIYQQVTKFERPSGTTPQGTIEPGSIAAREFQNALSYYAELKSRGPQIVQGGQLAPGATEVISSIGSGSAGSGGGFTGVGQGISNAFSSETSAETSGVKTITTAVTAPITGPIHTVEDAIKFVFSYRFLEILGGLGLIGIGAVGLIREVGGPKIGLPFGADRALDAAFAQGVSQGEIAQAREAGRRSVRRTSEETPASRRRRRIGEGAGDFGEVPF